MKKELYHTHHIIPKHMGGTDDPSNLIELTIEQHAEAHLKLYEEHGHWQDKVAYNALAGNITGEEARRLRVIESNKNREITEEFINKCRKAAIERERKKKERGYVQSEEHRRKNSEALKNRVFTEEHRRKLSKSAMGNKNGLKKK